MPVVVKKEPKPDLKPVDLAAPAAPPTITREEVERMLAARDAVWAKQIDSLTKALGTALAALKQDPPPAPPPRKGADIKFKFAPNGNPIGAEIIPKG